jgi:hypothetical protein
VGQLLIALGNSFPKQSRALVELSHGEKANAQWRQRVGACYIHEQCGHGHAQP